MSETDYTKMTISMTMAIIWAYIIISCIRNIGKLNDIKTKTDFSPLYMTRYNFLWIRYGVIHVIVICCFSMLIWYAIPYRKRMKIIKFMGIP
jgi:hypothetical protein